MLRLLLALVMSGLLAVMPSPVGASSQTGRIDTSGGKLELTLLGHASLIFKYGGKVIYVDPFSKVTDFSRLPKADLVLITHEHFDHLDGKALNRIITPKTVVIASEAAARQIKGARVMGNGDVAEVMGLKIEAVPAYNIVHKTKSGQPFHPKGRGNGYVITFGDKRVYVAGDTENVPEMKRLRDIDVAFLPVNLPYTMSADMVVDAARAFQPKILYPYHYLLGKSDLPRLKTMMTGVKGIDFRPGN